jgi:hypothetical protein
MDQVARVCVCSAPGPRYAHRAYREVDTIWPVTQRGLDSLARSGERTARVDILRDGELARRVDGTDPTLVLTGGSVKVDRAGIRRDGSVTLVSTDGTLLPDAADDLFAPLIGELRIWVGIRYWDWTDAEAIAGADVEWIPIATLVITGIDQSGAFEYVISGFDRMWFLSPFIGNYPIPAGTLVHSALSALLASQIPTAHLQMDLPETEFTTGALLYEEQASSLDAAHALALAMGMALYADPMGVITARPEPSTEDPPVLVYEPGSLSTMMRPQRGINAADVKNAIVYTGESPDGSPVRGYAEDGDPESVSYVGRVGVHSAFESSPLIRTAGQAQLAADTALRRLLGIAENIVVPVIQNPALESGDVIRVVDPDQGLDLVLVADSFPVTLPDGTQEITCRARVLR